MNKSTAENLVEELLKRPNWVTSSDDIIRSGKYENFDLYLSHSGIITLLENKKVVYSVRLIKDLEDYRLDKLILDAYEKNDEKRLFEYL